MSKKREMAKTVTLMLVVDGKQEEAVNKMLSKINPDEYLSFDMEPSPLDRGQKSIGVYLFNVSYLSWDNDSILLEGEPYGGMVISIPYKSAAVSLTITKELLLESIEAASNETT